MLISVFFDVIPTVTTQFEVEQSKMNSSVDLTLLGMIFF